MTPEVGERMAHLNEALNSGIALKRRIIEDLRPSSLSNLGLIAALDILVREFSARMELNVQAELLPVELRSSAELTIYRLVQEALTNIAKYARASEIVVKVAPVGDQVEVTVRDNGIGFDTRAPRLATHGLLGMQFRVESENGVMRIESAPGQGTTIIALLPSAKTAAAEPEAEQTAGVSA
jgi:signal transduction histidine kinase